MNTETIVREGYDRLFGGEKNMGMGERIVSTGLGLAIAAGGLRRGGDLPGAIMGLFGAAMVARGMSGHCPVKATLEGGHHQIAGSTGSQTEALSREPSYS
ncbi:DUF2892 domain-containing protein [Azospirillum sp. SYSU D00513]|uniref:YgaP family membrane protein n=1 Tax=Azospirillum sp. SYSU D00513 TaxID=2812561 RepID=UPI001A975282|nr:DUF2892 domain-containing protein [Azospirillum sp. SYSU D00513]